MSFVLSGAITGAAVVGLTSPTYTPTADVAPNSTSRQYAITTLGGTQTGVTVHGVASPFTITAHRPLAYKGLGYVDPAKGIRGTVPKNVHKVITRKGVIPLAGNSPVVMIMTTEISVPAGADLADPLSVKACISAHIGAVYAQASGLADTVVSGIL
jgi:hypothetical protein